MSDYVKLVVTVPEDSANSVREAVGDAGGGQIGDYSYCSFSSKGVGRFLPGEQAKPAIGTSGRKESVIEERIEFTCKAELLHEIIAALKKAHPYEEPAIDVYPLLSV